MHSIAIGTIGLLFLLLVSGRAAAQPSGTFVFDVPLRWTTASGGLTVSQQDPGAAIDVDHLFASVRGRVFYEMTVDSFGTLEGFRTWLHNAGVFGTFGGQERALDPGGSVSWRANEGAWGDAGFRGVNLLATARMKPGEAVTVSASYALYLRSFPDEPALAQAEHSGSVRALLPSRVETIGGPAVRNHWTWAARVAQSLADRTGGCAYFDNASSEPGESYRAHEVSAGIKVSF